MNLTCFELQSPLTVDEGTVATLILENPVFYRNFVADLLLSFRKESDRFILSDEREILDFSKNTEIITDVFNVSFDSRQIVTKVNQTVSEELRLSNIDSGKIIGDLNEMAAVVASRLEFDAVYNPLCDLDGVLKLFGFSVDTGGLSFLERITGYLDFMQKYCGKRLFILLNLKSTLSDEEYAEFSKLVLYKKLHVLCIENHKRETAFADETIRIIDKDLCEF